MNQTEFFEGFEKLSFGLGTGTFKVEKAMVYFRKLSHIPNGQFVSLVERLLDTHPRFPTIADIKQLYFAMFPRSEAIKASCSVCNGFGMVKLGMDMYRAPCVHGVDVSKKIALLNRSEAVDLVNQEINYNKIYGDDYWSKRKSQFPKIEETWERVIEKDPDEFMKGFCYVSEMMNRISPDVYKRVRQAILDTLGKEKATELYNKYAEEQTPREHSRAQTKQKLLSQAQKLIE